MMHQPDASAGQPAVILLVEDNPADAELATIGLESGKLTNKVYIAEDGEQAMAFLRRQDPFPTAPRPDLVLLDLNLPGMDGREVLEEVKSDPDLRTIPVIVLTTSNAGPDVAAAYRSHANAYMTKPVNFEKFHELMTGLQEYWFTLVRLPSEA
jgi:CheY-like chemotaxis protein